MYSAKQFVIKTLPTPGLPFNFDSTDSKATFELKTLELKESDLKEGEVLIESLLLSNDPAQKFWISSVDKNYAAGVQVGEIIPARGIAKILASKNGEFKAGDYVTGTIGWTTYAIIHDTKKAFLRKVSKEQVGDLSWHLSALGGTSLTAYFIFYHYAQFEENEKFNGKTILISGAAGAVGIVCIQIALHVFKAKKVIATAGGPEKIRYVEEFDPSRVVGVDYKDSNFKENLIKAAGGPNTVDLFIDNVGGDVLEIGTELLKPHSTLIVCGSISGYNDPSKLIYKSFVSVLTKRLTIKGVLLGDNIADFGKGLTKLSQMIEAGQLDISKAETLVDCTGEKFADVPNVWNGLFSGTNKGKLISKVNEY
ncbi:hypothetical protein TPHA_0D00100 [Tetrapisispora phaffii CBS 4417]|uniref:Enoyl reductase (ER) domain-containing protein n=1 Tax=Tetrapisispora phaffii (strain ATCC 24235 / CBS 4417 / NBRC 1672 / NRRL Y-8282 / UCD 70-5) TaxID=1071381 RepID=G8BS33_TETPH|nr:hypothetical protein TPHA_0D00100 [Tetrapisispora phaffii CBS 4417]CCE62654.1 hypothetical protein TPHA_0D00100 [Tetrapisispora phaffii CBS 4417]